MHLSENILKAYRESGPIPKEMNEESVNKERENRREDALTKLLYKEYKPAAEDAIQLLKVDREIFLPEGLLAYLGRGRYFISNSLFYADPQSAMPYIIEKSISY